MLKRIGLAVTAIAVLLPSLVVAQKAGINVSFLAIFAKLLCNSLVCRCGLESLSNRT